MIKVGNLTLNNPVCVAAGPWSLDVEPKGIGAIFTKTISRHPKAGTQTLYKTNMGYVNNYGLVNDGVKDFINSDLNAYLSKNVSIIVSIYFGPGENHNTTIRELNNFGVSGFELNISCPNARGYRLSDLDLNRRGNRIRKITDLPLRLKLPPDYSYLSSLLCYNYLEAFDAITMSNTVKVKVPHYRQPRENRKIISGGLSGKPLKPLSMAAVSLISEAGIKIPIFGCGGIDSKQDVVDYLSMGASAIQIGSAHLDDINCANRVSADFNTLRKLDKYR